MLSIIIFLIFFSVLFLITIKKPAFIIGGMLSIYVIEQLAAASHPYFAFNSKLTNLIIGGGVLFALLLTKEKLTFNASHKIKIVILSIFIYFYAVISIYWAPDFSDSFAYVAQALPYFILYLFLATWLISSLDDYRAVYESIIVVGALVLALLVFSGKLEVGGVRIPWILDQYGNPSRQNYLEIAKLAGIVMLVSLLSDVWSRSALWRIVKWLIAILCIAVSIKSGARGQTILGLLVLCMFLPLKYSIKDMKNVAFMMVVLPVLAVLFIYFLDIYWSDSDRWSSNLITQNADGRLEMAFALLRVWAAGDAFTLLFGLGNSSSYQILGIYPHIVPAEILAEEGILGFLIFTYVIFAYFRSLFYLNRKHIHLKGVLLPLGAVFLYTFLLIFKQGSLLGNIQLFYFGAMILVLRRIVAPQEFSKAKK